VSTLSRLRRVLTGEQQAGATPVSNAAYVDAGNQWYSPPVAGPSTLSRMVSGPTAVRRAMGVLERLECDAYHQFVLGFYRTGLGRFPGDWAHADLYTTLSGLSLALQPRHYLEIGVRHGHSMAMVLTQASACQPVGFDMWVENYAGLEHRGKPYVAQQLRSLGVEQAVEFVDGNSAETVPAFLSAHPERFFDLITVDGDHSARGARVDLENVLPRVTLGGAVVFDDVNNPSHPELRDVWTSTMEAHPEFSGWMFDEVGFGAAFAVRMK
jgi:predicted O-methyltransferase YrrM